MCAVVNAVVGIEIQLDPVSIHVMIENGQITGASTGSWAEVA